MNEVLTFSYGNAVELQEKLGNRPGKKYESFLRRTGFANKWMLYDTATGKWVYAKPGMRIERTPEGPRVAA